MKEEISKMIWEKMDELRSSIHFSGYGRFTNFSTLERIGEKFGIKKEKIRKWLIKNKIKETTRAEELSLTDWVRLTRTITHLKPVKLN